MGSAAEGTLQVSELHGPDPNNWRLGWDLRCLDAPPEGGPDCEDLIATCRLRSPRQPRTVDYPFTLIEIHLDKDGKGQGKMAYATKITFDKKKNSVELENYSSEPVRLNEVTLEKG